MRKIYFIWFLTSGNLQALKKCVVFPMAFFMAISLPVMAHATTSSPWKCQTTQEALGEKFLCQTNSVGDFGGNSFTLTLACRADGVAVNNIIGTTKTAALIKWPHTHLKANLAATVRFDSKPIENMNAGSPFYDDISLVFRSKFPSGGKPNEATHDAMVNKGTWKLMQKLAGVKNFAFEVTGADGTRKSGRFNVQNSIPIAAKFNSIGCRG